MRSPTAKAEIRLLQAQRKKILQLNESGISVPLLAIRFGASENRIRKALTLARKEKTGDANVPALRPNGE